MNERTYPLPTRCPHCGYLPEFAVTVCKRCGKSYFAPVHPISPFQSICEGLPRAQGGSELSNDAAARSQPRRSHGD